jgi:1-acyl-sn-glycerol-3-phosphate acyltransferase
MSSWPRYLLYEACYAASQLVYSVGFSLRTEHRSRIPSSGPCLLVANHQSYLDPLAIGLTARRHIHYLARMTLFRGLFGEFLRLVNCLPVDLEGTATDALRAALRLLQDGEAVLIFPEGTRTATGDLQALRPGVDLLMRRGRAPIVPIGIAGSFQAWSRHQKLPRLSPLFHAPTGAGIGVSVSRPIAPERIADLSREESLRLLHDELAQAFARAERLRRK